MFGGELIAAADLHEEEHMVRRTMCVALVLGSLAFAVAPAPSREPPREPPKPTFAAVLQDPATDPSGKLVHAACVDTRDDWYIGGPVYINGVLSSPGELAKYPGAQLTVTWQKGTADTRGRQPWSMTADRIDYTPKK
jgi:hypothetical protein